MIFIPQPPAYSAVAVEVAQVSDTQPSAPFEIQDTGPLVRQQSHVIAICWSILPGVIAQTEKAAFHGVD
jgi:hypothetical protein